MEQGARRAGTRKSLTSIRCQAEQLLQEGESLKKERNSIKIELAKNAKMLRDEERCESFRLDTVADTAQSFFVF